MAAHELQVAEVTNLHPESIRNPIAAGVCVVLPFEYFLRNGGQDALTEVADAVVHIEAGHRQNDPIAVLCPVGMIIGNQIAYIGCSFLACPFFCPLVCLCTSRLRIDFCPLLEYCGVAS